MDKKLCFGCMEYMEPEKESCQCEFVENEYESEPHHLKPGTLLRERYQVGKVMGEGGFGITYVGRDRVLDMKVAIKEFYMSGYVNRNNTVSTLVRASVGSHTELFERNREKFLTEARVLAKFANEEGIVGIRDFFQENNTAYIVMDFLTGETLRDYLKRNEKLPWEKTLQIMTPVLKSLGVVHKHNVIHRDISPDNIMLTNDGKVKLLDFGAAREVSQTDIKSLSVILKPGYAPEEQYRSKGMQGPWTDIYALCATIYCCVTGVVPDDSMERMFEDKLKTLHEMEPQCSIAVSNVIAKGMAVRQKDRYQSIAELQADLDKALANPNDAAIAGGQETENTVKTVVGSNIPERNNVDDNATVYAEEIADNLSEVTKITAPVDDNATVYAEEIVGKPKQAVAKEENVSEPKPQIQKEPKVKKVPEPKVVKPEPKAVMPESKEKKPLPKWAKIVIPVAAVLVMVIAGISVAGDNSSTSGEAQNAANVSKEDNNAIPETLRDYEVMINDALITLPATYQDFVDAGWEALDPAEFEQMELAPNNSSSSVELINVNQGFGKIMVYFTNPSSSVRKLKDCWVYKLYASTYALNENRFNASEPNEITINGDIVTGVTLEADFKKNYKDYKKKSYSNNTEYSYGSSYQSDAGDRTDGYYCFGFGDYVMDYVTVACYRAPADFVDSYEEKGPDYDTFELEEQAGLGYGVALTRGGIYYPIASSVKVQEYLNVGYTMAEGSEFLAAGATGNAVLRLDARTTLNISVMNPYKDAMAIEECIVYYTTFSRSKLLSDDVLTINFLDGTVLEGDATMEEHCTYLDSKELHYVKSSDKTLEIYPGGKDDERKVVVYFDGNGVWNMVDFRSSRELIEAFFAAQ